MCAEKHICQALKKKKPHQTIFIKRQNGQNRWIETVLLNICKLTLNWHSVAVGNYAAQTRMASLPGVVIRARLGTVPIIWLIALQNDFHFLFHHKKKNLQHAETLPPFIKQDLKRETEFQVLTNTGGKIHATHLNKDKVMCPLYFLVCVKWQFFCQSQSPWDMHVGVMFVWDVC